MQVTKKIYVTHEIASENVISFLKAIKPKFIYKFVSKTRSLCTCGTWGQEYWLHFPAGLH